MDPLIGASHSWDFDRLVWLREVHSWKIVIRLNTVVVVQVLHSDIAYRQPFTVGEDRLRWLAMSQQLDSCNYSLRHQEPHPLSSDYNTPGVQCIKLMSTLCISTWSKCDRSTRPRQHAIAWRTFLGYLAITAKRNRAKLVVDDLAGHNLLLAPTRNTTLHWE